MIFIIVLCTRLVVSSTSEKMKDPNSFFPQEVKLTGSSSSSSSPSVQLNGTKIVDEILVHIRKEIKSSHSDRIIIPDSNFEEDNNSIYLKNGIIKGLQNVYRVGDVLIIASILETKLKTAFAIYNVTSDQDVEIKSEIQNSSHGHVHADAVNVTIYQVYKFTYIDQELTLDEFEVSVGKINVQISGLGKEAREDGKISKAIVEKTKGPILTVFNVSFKMFVNSALKAAKAAVVAGLMG